jgi:endonuclease G
MGYAADFLPLDVPLPTGGDDLRLLEYTHFSVLLNPQRRLAAATAVNVDGAALLDLARGDDWHLDSRVSESEQAGPALYARNDLDRGHLVRRRDPVWGDRAVAERANADTFVYTNAAPQAAGFNQSKELWVGLEDHVLEYARAWRERISVFTGPVFAVSDPLYRGVRIPRLYWKVAAWATGGGTGLAAAGYLLDQTPQLDDVDLTTTRALAAGDSPPLGPFRTFQLPVEDVQRMTALAMPELAAADVLVAVPGTRPVSGWVELHSPADIRLER